MQIGTCQAREDRLKGSSFPDIGFCDEVFRVFAGGQPHDVLTPVGMNESVAFMVERAGRRADDPPDKLRQPQG